MRNEPKTMTAREMRTALNALTDDAPGLDMPVLWWGENRGGYVALVEPLAEDHYNPSGDGCEPVSILRDCHEHNRIDESQTFEEWLAMEEKVADKGQIVVHVDWYAPTPTESRDA